MEDAFLMCEHSGGGFPERLGAYVCGRKRLFLHPQPPGYSSTVYKHLVLLYVHSVN